MEGNTRVIVHLSNDLFQTYEKQAAGKDVEEVLAQRLQTCVTHTSERCLYFTAEQRNELEKLLNIPITTPALIIGAVKRMLSIQVGEIKVTLQPEVIERLRSRNHYTTFDEFVNEQTVQSLEEFVGLR